MRLLNPIILALVVTTTVLAQICVKKGSGQITFDVHNWTRSITALVTNRYIIGWVIFTGLTAPLWLYALRKYQLSFAYPFVMGLAFVLVTILSMWLFKEAISLTRCIGIILLCIGLLLVSG